MPRSSARAAMPDAMPSPTRFAAPDAMPTQASYAPSRSMVFAEEALVDGAVDGAPASSSAPASASASTPENRATARVRVRPWMPDAPYLKELDKAARSSIEKAHGTYYGQRSSYATSPSFFLDCAGWFIAHDDDVFAVQVLSNLAELRIEDAALLRVMGWRLREAGRLKEALVTLRRALKLRKEDAQGYRDVALVLDELARAAFAADDEDAARAYALEAGELYRKVALTPWQRHPLSIGLFAVEEYNVFRAWADAQRWQNAPDLPSLGENLEGVPDCDLRITLAWDADETDVDIHVTEPTGEEAYYAHRFTQSGGRVSEDITDGYGPELYEVREAMDGSYAIKAHYFASRQQALFGPATCTLTVYTDWGRPAQRQQITTTRLNNRKEMVDVGTASYGDKPVDEEQTSQRPEMRLGMSLDEVVEILGLPASTNEGEALIECLWEEEDGRELIALFRRDALERIVEQTPWGEQMIVLQ